MKAKIVLAGLLFSVTMPVYKPLAPSEYAAWYQQGKLIVDYVGGVKKQIDNLAVDKLATAFKTMIKA